MQDLFAVEEDSRDDMTAPYTRYRAGDLGYLKQLNRAAVIDVIRREPGVSRAEIATRSGLTKPTVSAVVQELLDQNWLVEGALQQGASGRPGRSLRFNDDWYVLLGAEVGVHGIRTVACTLSGTLIHQITSTTAPAGPEDTAARLADQLTELLRHPLLQNPDSAHREVLGLGVAVPGPVAHEEARVLSAPNLGHQGWRDVPFLDLLRPHLPTLGGRWLLDNEAKAAAFGEFFFHEGEAPESLVYISVATGIGSGLVSGSSPPGLLRGAHGLAGELGHTVLQPGGLYCHCGNRGCAETLTSGWAIRAALGLPEGAPIDESLQSRLDDPNVHVTLRRAGEALGMLLLNTHHTFNPAEIVIGGSLTRLGPALLGPATSYFDTHRNRLLNAQRTVRVRVVPDSTYLPARGAAAQVLADVVHGPGGHA